MTEYIVPLKNRQEIAKDTLAFYFTKPEGFNYKAGQFCRFTLLNPKETDAEGNIRTFTLASTPEEKDLMIATRFRDTAFKRSLKTMPLGGKIQLNGPFGTFVLQDNPSIPVVFLTGGIGITPARSIVYSALQEKLAFKFFVFYSNRQPEEMAFFDEFQKLSSEFPNFKFIPTITQADNSTTSWSGEKGRINKEMLTKYIPDINLPIYYISGPEAMVSALKEMLLGAGISETNIRTENFTGY